MTDQGYVDNCIFCKVAKKLVRAEIVFEDEAVVASLGI